MLTGASIPVTALQELSALLLERAGLRIASDGFRSLRWALGERMPALGVSDANAYVRHLREPGGEEELRALLPHVTVTHTEFFRDPRQFHALEHRVLPDLLAKARAEKRPLRIWSAGCATGEEPYSLAIALDELGATPDELELWGTDLNGSAISAARLGRFPPRRVLQVSASRRERYFDPVDDGFQLRERLRAFVRFESHNLAAPLPALAAPQSLDLVLCRNVIIYFSPHTIRALLDRFFEALRPGGMLVLGYSESLFRVYDRFEMTEVEGAFLYRRPLSSNTVAAAASAPPPPPPLRREEKRTQNLPRITSAIHAPPPQPLSLPAARSLPPEERLATAVALAERGHFEQAIDSLRALLHEHPHHLPARLSLGNLHSLMGRVGDAQALFAQVLTDEPLCVEARLYAAMAQVQAQRYEPARDELQKALFLEPSLALSHYLSAQVHERLGDAAAARRAYRNALAQLGSPQRVLAGFYPDLPESPEVIFRAARHALAALEES